MLVRGRRANLVVLVFFLALCPAFALGGLFVRV
jgi:hypothetical protein